MGQSQVCPSFTAVQKNAWLNWVSKARLGNEPLGSPKPNGKALGWEFDRSIEP